MKSGVDTGRSNKSDPVAFCFFELRERYFGTLFVNASETYLRFQGK